MHLTRLLWAACAAALIPLAPQPARADEPSCDDGKRAPAASICGEFERAPKLAGTDPVAQKVLAVWRRVAPPVAALTGRETALAVLADDARTADGHAFPPSAYICPGSPPIVYVPATLTDKVVGPNAAYGEDFLGFVLGHELGHRINDYTADGCELAAFERPGHAIKEEQLADFRGAFFAAVAGFSTRRLAREDTVNAFLEAEFHVRARVRDERREALLGALAEFDAYEELYASGVALAFAGDSTAALRLLGWADELVEKRHVPLPELKVVHALALVLDAASDAPWLEATDGIGVDLSALRCRPVLASHTPLAEEPQGGRVRGPGEARERARRSLVAARTLLGRAAELGADPLLTDSARACVAFYLGDFSEAARWQARTTRRVARAAPQVQRALGANAALIAFGSALAADPPPDRSDRTKARAWAQRLSAAKVAFAANAQLAAAVARLADYPQTAKSTTKSAMLACAKKAAAGAALPAAPSFKGAVGQCPSGWKALFSTPTPETIQRTGTGLGVTTCAAADGTRFVHVQLAGALDPPYADVDRTLRYHSVMPRGAETIDAWACACDAVEAQGVSDVGEDVYLAACPGLGVPLGVVFVGNGGRVSRVVSVGDRD